MKCKTCAFGTGGGYCTLSEEFKHNCRNNNYSTYEEYAEALNKEDPDTITLKRIYATHCQVCSIPFTCVEDIEKIKIVYFVPLDNNITCHECAKESGYPYEPRIYKKGE